MEEMPEGGHEPQKRRKRKQAADASLGPLGWVLGGGVGGLIGGAIWVAIGHFTGFEIGWIAWGIGFLVGLGVYIGAGDRPSVASGGVAAAIALVSILIAKFLVVNLGVQQMQAKLQDEGGQKQFLMAMVAREVAAEFEQQGREVKWPRRRMGRFRQQVDPDEAFEADDFPTDVWNEAKTRVEQLPAEEREAMQQALAEIGRNALQEAGAAGVMEIFVKSLFHPLNLLWFFLAGASAFKLGAGLQSED